MGKSLSKMTLEELWQLFPIILSEHQASWKAWYIEEEKRLYSILSINKGIRVHHIGSTAIYNIWAKPIIDILIELPEYMAMNVIKEKLVLNGYICMSEKENKISFNKGYTNEGFAEQVFHLHVRYIGDNDELYFRDYMNEHHPIAKQYEALKLSLWKQFEHNRDGYTNAKSDFINKWTKVARKEYKDKYAY